MIRNTWTCNDSSFTTNVVFTSTRYVRVPDPFVDYEGDWKLQLANGFAFTAEEETPNIWITDDEARRRHQYAAAGGFKYERAVDVSCGTGLRPRLCQGR